VSAQIINLAERRAKANGVRDDSDGKHIEFKGDEVMILVLRGAGEADAWVSNEIQTEEQWDYVFDFLRQVDVGLVRPRNRRDK
jgi:hypothetical protein